MYAETFGDRAFLHICTQLCPKNRASLHSLIRPLFLDFWFLIRDSAVRARAITIIPKVRLTLEILHGRSVLLSCSCTGLPNCCGVKGQHACTIEIIAPAERLGIEAAADEKLGA